MSTQRLLLAVAGAALLACAIGLATDPVSTLAAWLAAEIFWLALPLAALGLTLIGALTGRAWLRPAASQLAFAIGTLPVLALAFLPVLAGLGLLYPWAAGERAPSVAFWLDRPFFIARAVGYFAIWLSLGIAALRRGVEVSEGAAAAGLVLLGVSLNFAALDWTLSLDHRFASTGYGYIAITAALLGGTALLLLGRGGEPPRALAALCLALVSLWAYLAFMQYLIVWESDLAREIPWYLRRGASPWPAVGIGIGLAHGLAFLLLLSRRTRLGGAALGVACASIVVGRMLDAWWLVIPDVRGAALSWQAPAAMVALGSLLGAARRARFAERIAHG